MVRYQTGSANVSREQHTQNKVYKPFLQQHAFFIILLSCLAMSDAFNAVRISPLSSQVLRSNHGSGFWGPRSTSQRRSLVHVGMVLSTGEDALAVQNPVVPRSTLEAGSAEGWRGFLSRLPLLKNEKVQAKLKLIVKTLWWLLALPLGIAGYLASVHVLAVMYKACPQCVDPMNILLFSIKLPFLPAALPVCLWNLSHLFMYYHFVRVIPFKRFGANHAFAVFIGVLWFYMEPALFTLFASKEIVSAAHACSSSALVKTVYESTWRPRADDIVFNTCGQILYEVVRFFKRRQQRNEGELDEEEASKLLGEASMRA